MDIENGFKPKYVAIKGKQKYVKQIKDAAQKVDSILIATDPDREGEAIGWHLAHEGRQVQLIDLLPKEKLLADEHPVNRATLFHQLKNANVSLICGATTKQITDQGALVALPGGDEKLFAADSVVSSVGFKPRRKLYKKLMNMKNAWDVYAVGDCVKVENFYHAVQSAFQLARHI